MPEAEVLGGDQEILQGAADADVQLPAARVRDGQGSTEIRNEVDPISLDVKGPGLTVPGLSGQDAVPEEKAELGLDGGRRREVVLGEVPDMPGHG